MEREKNEGNCLVCQVQMFYTWFGGCLNQSPGRIWPSACNEVTLVGLESIREQVAQGWAKALQYQTTQTGIYTAVSRKSL